jgi:threonine/homoserine/homoserine lactone efflux protein
MLISLISQTIIIVLLLAFSFGPAFFSLLNAGIKHGYKYGSFLATGIILSDFFLCVLVCFLIHFGSTNLIQDEKNQRFAGILAGIVLIVFGAFYFKRPVSKTEESIEVKVPAPAVLLIRGFLLNLFNPTVWLLWLGNVTAVGKTLEYSLFKMIIYFSFVLGLVLMIELAKVFVAGKVKKFLTEKVMHTVNFVTGVLLVVFGIGLIYNHYF